MLESVNADFWQQGALIDGLHSEDTTLRALWWWMSEFFESLPCFGRKRILNYFLLHYYNHIQGSVYFETKLSSEGIPKSNLVKEAKVIKVQ